jgi:hypothetical protein
MVTEGNDHGDKNRSVLVKNAPICGNLKKGYDPSYRFFGAHAGV